MPVTPPKNNKSNQPLLVVKDLVKHFLVNRKSIFAQGGGVIRAVDGVSFTINAGEVLGLVGESGCGKSTIGRVILRLLPATSGKVFFNSHDVLTAQKEELYRLRGEMQIIFQDPYSSLNPRRTVEQTIGEALTLHQGLRGKAAKVRIKELLEIVGLSAKYISRYPHEFSGGQRQRIGLARALAVEPKFIVCDEPVSALDVSIQAQILNLFQELQYKFIGLTYLFISHDLAVIRHVSDHVAVMYVGKIVEIADGDTIYKEALHPYTQMLMQAVPKPNPHVRQEFKLLEGELPSSFHLPAGCRFHPRCDRTMSICKKQEPQLIKIGDNHWVACHLYTKQRSDFGVKQKECTD